MPTKKFIAEQVLYRIKGGTPDTSSTVQEEDVIAAIAQKVNELLKIQYFQTNLASGETIPDGAVMATYELPVTVFGKKSKSILTVVPVTLPRNMGIWEVSPREDFSCLYIPMQSGQSFLLQGQPLISDLIGQVGYEVYNNQLVYTKDITVDSITKVYVREIVMDVTTLSIYAPLPIPADMENTLIEQLVKAFAPVGNGDPKIDNYTP